METREMMRDHWWWRPGWRIGQRAYTWHVTFAGQGLFHRHASAYQSALSGLSGLDLIPLPWLHLTMQGVGFADEVAVEDLEAIANAARSRCNSVTSFELTFGSPVVDPEAIMFAAHPTDSIRALRTQVRAAIADVWGEGRVPEAEDWSPHVSIAYSNSTGSAEPFADTLSNVAIEPATVLVQSVELIILNRDNKMYEWETVASVPLSPAAPGDTPP